VNLYVAFTIARWTFEFSVGFARTLEFVIAVRDADVLVKLAESTDELTDAFGTVYGTLNADGTFVPSGVSIEDQNRTG